VVFESENFRYDCSILQQAELLGFPWEVAPEMSNLQDEMQIAIYQDRQYVWQYPKHTDMLNYFFNLLKL
jgi:hypothetical protein